MNDHDHAHVCAYDLFPYGHDHDPYAYDRGHGDHGRGHVRDHGRGDHDLYVFYPYCCVYDHVDLSLYGNVVILKLSNQNLSQALNYQFDLSSFDYLNLSSLNNLKHDFSLHLYRHHQI